MNRAEISGTITQDPEIRWLGEGDRRFPIATLNVAVNDADGRWDRDSGKTAVGSGFYRIEVPGDLGVDVHEQSRKGDTVYVVGSLTQFTGRDEKSHTQIRATICIVMPRGPRPDRRPPGAAAAAAGGYDDAGEEPF